MNQIPCLNIKKLDIGKRLSTNFVDKHFFFFFNVNQIPVQYLFWNRFINFNKTDIFLQLGTLESLINDHGRLLIFWNSLFSVM